MLISVIIASYNRCELLKEALESLAQQERIKDFNFEVIVVDNNSKDKTKTVVDSFKKEFNGQLKYLFEPQQGKSYALNRGIKEAKGEIISFTDDDCIVAKDWLINIYDAFKKYNPAIAGGKVMLKRDVQLPEWFSDELSGVFNIFDKGNEIFQADNEYKNIVGTGSNISFSKNIFENELFRTNLGPKGIKYQMGEDTELYWRVKRRGEKCMYFPNIIVCHKTHLNKLNKNYIRKWFFSWGKWCCVLSYIRNDKINKQIFGIPRWKYKKFFYDLLGLIWFTIKKSKQKAFYKEVCLIAFFGFCFQKIKSLLTNNPLEPYIDENKLKCKARF